MLRDARKRHPGANGLTLAEPEGAAIAGTMVKTGPKILVIDDTEMLLIFVEDSLTLADPTLQVTTALTGLNGAKEAARITPDLVLADYVLPDIKGDEVCRRIGRNESTARVPIIMMSGHVHEMAAVASKLPNVVASIAKPFRSDALVALVQQTLKDGPLKERPTSWHHLSIRSRTLSTPERWTLGRNAMKKRSPHFSAHAMPSGQRNPSRFERLT